MGIQFLPDSSQKSFRFRSSVRRAGGKTAGTFVYSNVKPRYPTRVHMDHDTKKPLPSNKQNKIRFFGFLHQRVDHGPVKAAKRFKQAELRWEAGYGHRKRCSMRMRDRMRSYI